MTKIRKSSHLVLFRETSSPAESDVIVRVVKCACELVGD